MTEIGKPNEPLVAAVPSVGALRRGRGDPDGRGVVVLRHAGEHRPPHRREVSAV